MKIIFQNEDFIIVDKPAGLAVHRGMNGNEKTLVDFLIGKFPEIRGVGDDPLHRPGIVHRLDKETSGVMIVARSQETFFYLKNLFKKRRIKKKYLVLIHGRLKKKEGRIEGEMGRSKRDFRKYSLVRGKVRVRKERYSLSRYKVLEEFGDMTLVEVSPETGRTHQIRVHLQSIGHPIVGDKKYSFKEHKKTEFPRMFLHASEIIFPGKDGGLKKFSSPTPEEFSRLAS